MKPEDLAVVELSSFQLMGMRAFSARRGDHQPHAQPSGLSQGLRRVCAGKDGHLPQPEGRRPSHPQPR
ncbi:MAG: hypothetical protein ACLR4Z_10575 [Butyricicoccaceae bacterium]